MIDRFSSSRQTLKRPAFYAALLVFGLTTAGSAYVLEGPRWLSSPVSMQMNLSATSYRLQDLPGFPLADGSGSWESAYSAGANVWNQYMARMRLAIYQSNNSQGGQSGDAVNEAFFGSSIGGSRLDSNTLALTIYIYNPNTNGMTEADTAFNPTISWNSYRGPLAANGVIDFRRVAIHELGHVLGLDHPDTHGQDVNAIMNSIVSDVDTVTADDIAGIQALYGAPANGSPTPTPTRPSPVITTFLSYPGDFNGDGKQDILWRNTQTGEVDIWFMNGVSAISKASFGLVGLNWRIVGTADFNGDGLSDILWQNTATGDFGIWIMHGSSYSGYGFSSQGSQWSIAGVADLDHTGFAGILWRNVVTGQLVVWRSRPGLTFSTATIGTAGLDWDLEGAADLLGNGHSALIWRNQHSGQVIAWQLNGNSITAQSILGAEPLNWSIAGFGDFNGDRHIDILWHNNSNGSVAAWLMNGFAVSPIWIDRSSVSQDWQIRATPDVFGNGINDILWSNLKTGQQVIWLLGGAGVSQRNLGFVPLSWAVQR